MEGAGICVEMKPVREVSNGSDPTIGDPPLMDDSGNRIRERTPVLLAPTLGRM